MAILAYEPLEEATVGALIRFMADRRKASGYVFVMELEFFSGRKSFDAPL
jgi:hypothetical protein